MAFSNLTLKIYRQGRGQGSRSRLYIKQLKLLIHNGFLFTPIRSSILKAESIYHSALKFQGEGHCPIKEKSICKTIYIYKIAAYLLNPYIYIYVPL